jgi:hypothetical protein
MFFNNLLIMWPNRAERPKRFLNVVFAPLFGCDPAVVWSAVGNRDVLERERSGAEAHSDCPA